MSMSSSGSGFGSYYYCSSNEGHIFFGTKVLGTIAPEFCSSGVIMKVLEKSPH